MKLKNLTLGVMAAAIIAPLPVMSAEKELTLKVSEATTKIHDEEEHLGRYENLAYMELESEGYTFILEFEGSAYYKDATSTRPALVTMKVDDVLTIKSPSGHPMKRIVFVNDNSSISGFSTETGTCEVTRDSSEGIYQIVWSYDEGTETLQLVCIKDGTSYSSTQFSQLLVTIEVDGEDPDDPGDDPDDPGVDPDDPGDDPDDPGVDPDDPGDDPDDPGVDPDDPGDDPDDPGVDPDDPGNDPDDPGVDPEDPDDPADPENPDDPGVLPQAPKPEISGQRVGDKWQISFTAQKEDDTPLRFHYTYASGSGVTEATLTTLPDPTEDDAYVEEGGTVDVSNATAIKVIAAGEGFSPSEVTGAYYDVATVNEITFVPTEDGNVQKIIYLRAGSAVPVGKRVYNLQGQEVSLTIPCDGVYVVF